MGFRILVGAKTLKLNNNPLILIRSTAIEYSPKTIGFGTGLWCNSEIGKSDRLVDSYAKCFPFGCAKQCNYENNIYDDLLENS